MVTEESIVTQKGEIGLETFFLLDKINNQEFAYLNFTYKPWVIKTYSKDLDSLRSLKIEVQKDDYPIYFDMTDEKIYLIIGSEFSNFLTITGKIFNAKDGKQISETKMLNVKLYDMYENEKFEISNLNFILSPDESKFLLYFARYPEGKSFDAYEFYAFNREYEQINNFTQKIDINDNDFFDFFIDNDGYIISVIDYTLDEKFMISAQKVMQQNITTLTADLPRKIQNDFFPLHLNSRKSILDKNNSIITISNLCNASNESEFIVACNFDFTNNKVTTKNIFEKSDTWVDSLDFSLEIEDFKIIDILTEKNNNKTVVLQYDTDDIRISSRDYDYSVGKKKTIVKGIDRVDTYLTKGPVVVFSLDSNLNILNKNAIDKESKHGVSKIPVFGFEYYKAPRRIAYDYDVYSIYRNSNLNLFYINIDFHGNKTL